MAHIAKYKAPSVGHMLAHYRGARRELERSGAARGFGNRGGDASR